MTLLTETLIQVFAIPSIMLVLSFGATFQRIKQLEKKLDNLTDLHERLISMETKLDLILNNKIKQQS